MTYFPQRSRLQHGRHRLRRPVVRCFEALEPRAMLAVSPGPIANWQLSELSGATAFDSAGGYSGAYVNAPTLGKTGAAYDTGTAAAFNGTNQDVGIGNPAALNFAGQITLSAWIKPLSSSGVQNIIEHGDQSASGTSYVSLCLAGGSYEIVSNNGSGAQVASSPIPAGDLNTWVHLAGVYNGTTWTLYRDGAQVAQTASAVGAVTVGSNWAIAASGPGTSQFFQGNIQDVSIYPRALSVGEVSQLAETDSPALPFASALAASALVQSPMTSGIPGSLILGNGDLNGILWINGGQLQFQILKNDVADGVLNTGSDPALPTVNFSTHSYTNVGSGRPSWNNYSNPCPVVLGQASFSLGGSTLSSTLDVQNATAIVTAAGGNSLSAMILQDRNVVEFDTAGTVSLAGNSGSYTPAAITTSGTTNGIQWYSTTIPGNSDVPSMSYAMAMATSGTRHVLAAVSSLDSAAPLAAAQQLAANTLSVSLAQLQAAQTTAWAHFWARSGVQLANSSLQTQWYRNLYYAACASRPGAQPIQLFLGTNNVNFPSDYWWHGMETTDYNMEQTYWGSYAAGHPELSEPYTQYFVGYEPVAQWYAQNVYGQSGAAYPHNQWVNECTNPAASTLTNHGMLAYPPYSLTVGLGGWILQNVWNSYLYDPDPNYLSTTAYPLMKQAAIFYAGVLNACHKDAGGKAIYGPTYVEELGSYGVDNATSDIGFTQLALQAAIQAAQTLGVDAALVSGWQQALALLPGYPTATGSSGTVVTGAQTWNASVAYNIAVPVIPVYPTGVVNYFSPAAQRALFLNTIQTVNWGVANSVVIMAGAYARLAPAQTAYNFITSAFSQYQQANGMLTVNGNQNGNFTEGFAASGVISEMLLQSVGGIARFFPAMPSTQNASFANLGAQGGFTVSGAQQNGTVGPITVTASQPADFKFLSPWQYVTVAINGQNVTPVNNGGGVYTISASAWSTTSPAGMQAVLAQFVPTVVAPAANSYVRGGTFVNTNYGSDIVLWVKNDPSAVGDRQAYLKFDLTSAAAPIQTAYLTLTPTYLGSGAAGMTITVQLVPDNGDNWTQSGLTWNNAPQAAGLTATISGSQLRIGVPVQVDVTALVNQALNANGLATFELYASSPASIYQYAEFASSNHGTAAWRPTLVVMPNGSPSSPAASTAAIDGATVVVTGDAALATAANPLVVQDGGAFDLAGTSQNFAAVTLTDGSISNGALNAIAYNLGQGTVGADLAGQGAALLKSSSGAVVLSGVNSYSGGTTVLEGILIVDNVGALPDGGSLSVGDQAQVAFERPALDIQPTPSESSISNQTVAIALASPAAPTALVATIPDADYSPRTSPAISPSTVHDGASLGNVDVAIAIVARQAATEKWRAAAQRVLGGSSSAQDQDRASRIVDLLMISYGDRTAR
jgi:autotransporter-associated beta strand protein